MSDQEVKKVGSRGQYFAVMKSKQVDSNYAITLEAPTRKELAKIVAATAVTPGGADLELVLAVRGKKLLAQEQRTVSFV
jgi:hypothetical protein